MDNDQVFTQTPAEDQDGGAVPAKKAVRRTRTAKRADAPAGMPEPVDSEPTKAAPARRSRAKKTAGPEVDANGPEADVSGPDAVALAPSADVPVSDQAVVDPAAVDQAAVDPAGAGQPVAKKSPIRRVRAKKVPEPAAAPELIATQELIATPEAEAGPESSVGDVTPARRSRKRTQAAPAPATVQAAQETTDAAAGLTERQDVTAPEHVTAPEVEETAATVNHPAEAPQLASPVSVLFQAPDLSVILPVAPAAPADSLEDAASEGRSRRGRNRRGRNARSADSADGVNGSAGSGTDDTADSGDTRPEAAPAAANDSGDGTTSRRRRRRRRGEADLELTGGTDDDPPNTVTRVRAPRQPSEVPASDKVTSLRGSTRLEAKKQRRRESRDSGRRRQVITEAEFLARRESVDRAMVVRQRDDRIQIGVLEDGILAEHFVSKTQQDSLIGNVYLGKVQNVLPSMEAAFVDIGRGRNAVLYAGEVNWDAAHLDGQPRRIEHALKSGDAVLVQVTKDPVGHKGARLTSQISLPGRYLVYVPGGSMTGISRKLPDVERNRLKRILKDHLPENAGVIVRTAAEGASEEELTHDINRLRVQWEGIESRATAAKTLSPEMLYGEPDLTIKVVRDVFNEDFSKLIVSGEEAWDTVEAYVTYVAPDLVDRLEKWTKDEDIFAAHRIDEQIAKALERKVFLPSGGSLVIDRTEAMTVVDVNTGKFTGSGGNLEETVTKNNLEAAEEVVRQLRLRDIGGIIVIDFIDMVLESNRDLVLRRLVECLGRDRTKHQVAEVTSLGLVQMTRKRMGTGLLEVFGEQCEHCAGRGVVTHDVPVEHRRSQHAQAAETHQVQPRIEQAGSTQRPSRNEKKRSRSRGNGQPAADQHDHQGPPVHHDELSEAERLAKANAARAALATIAAATHAAHHDGAAEAGHPAADHQPATEHRTAAEPSMEQGAAGIQPAEGRVPAESEAPEREAAGRPAAERPAPATEDGPVLTIGGEAVALPWGGHSVQQPSVDPEKALAGLAQALDQIADAPYSEDHSGLDQNGQPAHERPRRGRRNRAASRPQGAANTNDVHRRQESERRPADAPAHRVEVSTPAPAAHRAENPAVNAGQAPSGTAEPSAKAVQAAPIILGVGVPASDL